MATVSLTSGGYTVNDVFLTKSQYSAWKSAGSPTNVSRWLSGSSGTTSTKTSTTTSTKTSTSGGTSSSYTAPTTSISQQDYFLKPGESITDYNARIAALRGDTPEQLASMQKAAQTYATANPTSSFAARLPSTTAPTSSDGITTGVLPYKAPTLTPSTGSIFDATAGVAGLDAQLQAMQAATEKYQNQRLEQEKLRGEQQKSIFDKFLGNQESPGDARERAWDETGIDVEKYFAEQERGIKEIQTLADEYASVVAAKDQQIAQTNDKMASMNFINNQIAQIERNAAPVLNRISANINAKAAALQAFQGNFAEARAYVNQAVQDATAEAKFNYDMYETMWKMNEDSFNRVDAIYADSFNATMKIAEMNYEEQLAEKNKIGDLLLKYPTAGIRMDDTLEQAAAKIASQIKSTGTVTQEARLRAEQVMAGFLNLDQLTPTQAAEVRDALYLMASEAPTASYTQSLQNERLQSIMPSEVQKTWTSDVFDAALRVSETADFSSPITASKEQLLYIAGATATDIAQLNQLLSSGLSYEQIKQQYGVPDAIYQVLIQQ